MEKDLLLRPDILMYAKMAQRGLGYVAGQVELTSYCEQRCIACESWREHVKNETHGALSFETIKYLVNQLNEMSTFEHLSMTGGEPILWKDSMLPEMDFDKLLLALKIQGIRFTLQVNTALVRTADFQIWRDVLSRVRVSLDGIKKETYKRMRGVEQDPEVIIQRMEELAHPGLAVMVCVAKENIKEVPEIIRRLNAMNNPPRKAMFLAVLGRQLNPEFWEEYRTLKLISSSRMATSFSEDVSYVREFCNSEEAEKLPCYAGKISFHIKCNGDLHECCLAGGGEAIKSRKEMAIGNVYRQSLIEIQNLYQPKFHYKKGGVCSEVCQFKQLYMNRIAHEASKTILTMP